jgi:hypothetical protein
VAPDSRSWWGNLTADGADCTDKETNSRAITLALPRFGGQEVNA